MFPFVLFPATVIGDHLLIIVNVGALLGVALAGSIMMVWAMWLANLPQPKARWNR